MERTWRILKQTAGSIKYKITRFRQIWNISRQFLYNTKNDIEDERHLRLAFISLSTTVEPLELTVWNHEHDTA